MGGYVYYRFLMFLFERIRKKFETMTSLLMPSSLAEHEKHDWLMQKFKQFDLLNYCFAAISFGNIDFPSLVLCFLRQKVISPYSYFAVISIIFHGFILVDTGLYTIGSLLGD